MDAIVSAVSRVPLPALLEQFIGLSYPVPAPDDIDSYYDATYYNKGPKDFLFIASWVVLLALFRELLIRFFFMPIARWRFASLAATKRNARPTSPNGAPPRPKTNARSASEKAAKPPRDGSKPANQRRSTPPAKTHKHAKSWTATKKERDAKLLERNVVRFAEQGWSLAYYSLFWALGVNIYVNLPCFPLQTKHFWINYPVRFLPGPIKFYYLCQLSCWVHQLIVLHIEEKRKDHYQMLAHHIITIALMVGSYITHFTRVGIAILVIMDFCDIILPLAKMLLYLRMPSIFPDTAFGFFVLSWLVTRQGAFTLVVWSVIAESCVYVKFDFRPMDGRFWSKPTYYGFVTFLVSLLVLLCVWFWMICRIAYGVLIGKPAEDTRSDEEDETDSSSSTTLAPTSPSDTDSDTLTGGPTPPKSPKKS